MIKQLWRKSNTQRNTDNITGLHNGVWGDFRFIRGNVSSVHGDVGGLAGNISAISGYVSNIYGDLDGIFGNVSGIMGDITNITGDTTGVHGDIDNCEITNNEDSYNENNAIRVDINDLINNVIKGEV